MKLTQHILPVVALIISLASASFSYLQSRTSAAQLRLAEQQVRPHVSYVPTFFRKKGGLYIDMYLQNQSQTPANVLYTDLAAWIGEDFLSPNFHSMSPDIIYQEKGGLSSPPPITGIPLSRIEKDGATLVIATCAVYGSTSASDSRRWIQVGLHKYIPGSSLASRLFMKEEAVSSTEATCLAKAIKDRLNMHTATPPSAAGNPIK